MLCEKTADLARSADVAPDDRPRHLGSWDDMMRNAMIAMTLAAGVGLAGCTENIGPKQGVGTVAGAVSRGG